MKLRGWALLAVLTAAMPSPAKAAKGGLKASPVPGGVALIALKGGAQAPRVSYHGESVLTRRSGAGWQAVVGLPLSAKPGPDEVEVDGRAVSFTIQPKHYPEQRLRL
ncbi:MAG: M23 family peptidase, partial [Holophagaceae bacterium]|nr:M23 family peptidase [Holophagaceae bacterium]